MCQINETVCIHGGFIHISEKSLYHFHYKSINQLMALKMLSNVTIKKSILPNPCRTQLNHYFYQAIKKYTLPYETSLVSWFSR